MSNDFEMCNLYPVARQHGWVLTGEVQAGEFTADFSSYFRKGSTDIEVSSDGITGVIWGAARVDAPSGVLGSDDDVLTEVFDDGDIAATAVRWFEGA